MGRNESQLQACPPSLRPTEYTAALLRQLQLNSSAIEGARVLEIGCGSGVLLAALARFGARLVCGIDIERDAVLCATSLLRDIGHPEATVYRGDLWQPVAGRTFDLVTANLPHFPMRPAPFGCRPPSWGCGGADGRRFLDPFLRGLPAHLAPAGRALITHNAFVDLDRSRDILQAGGLKLCVVATLNVYIAEEKLELMTPAVLLRERGRTLWQFGSHVFAAMNIVEITR
jgi:release factor glutamine methyltransferase